MSTPRKLLVLAVFLLSIALLAFGTDLGSSFGAFFQSISPRPGANTATYSLSSGLVGYWTFDGKDTNWNANTTSDLSGQGNTGTMTFMSTTTSPVPGKLGQGFKFDGVNDIIPMGTGTSLELSLPITFSAWMYPRTDKAVGFIITTDRNTIGTYSGAWMFLEKNNSKNIAIGYGSNTACNSTSKRDGETSDNAFALNTWSHVVGVIRAATDMSTYVNGVDVGALSYGGTGGSIAYDNASSPSIGSVGACNSNATFDGTLDDVRVYNRALSADEVKQLYLQGSSLKQNITPRPGSNTPSYTLEGGLVGHWTFDGKDTNWNSNTTNDLSGNSNTGTMTSMSTTTSPVPGKLGQGFLFDGVNDRVDIDTLADDLQSGSFSMAFWFKPSSTFNSSSPVNNYLVSVADGPSTNDARLGLAGSNGALAFIHIDSGGVQRQLNSTATSWTGGTWYHAVGTFETGVIKKLYINGVEDVSVATNITRGAVFSTNGDIGALNGTVYFGGLIDDVRIYNRALSADEVKQLYLQGSSLKQNITPRKGSNTPSYTLEGGLVGHWTFDGKDTAWNTNTTSDVSGNSNTGTMTSMSTTTSPVPGKLGQGFKFDGVDDYVDVTDSVPLSPTTAVTVSVWYKQFATASNDWGLVNKDISGGITNPPYGLRILNGTTGQVNFTIVQSDNTACDAALTGFPADLNVWHHAVGTFSANNELLYIDGAQVASNTTCTNIGDTTTSLKIGQQKAGFGRFFPGLIDDVRVYNRALSADEVKQLYLMGR